MIIKYEFNIENLKNFLPISLLFLLSTSFSFLLANQKEVNKDDLKADKGETRIKGEDIKDEPSLLNFLVNLDDYDAYINNLISFYNGILYQELLIDALKIIKCL